jgi:hypothetical protein
MLPISTQRADLAVIKHGQHDQSSHGSWATGGGGGIAARQETYNTSYFQGKEDGRTDGLQDGSKGRAPLKLDETAIEKLDLENQSKEKVEEIGYDRGYLDGYTDGFIEGELF